LIGLNRFYIKLYYQPIINVSGNKGGGFVIREEVLSKNGYPGRYYTVLRNTPVIPEFFGVKIESVVDKDGSPKQV
jgi:hypothetical protein